MDTDRFVCVDWGTSRMRASLCDFAGGRLRELDTRAGPGVLAARGRIEDTLFDTIEPWVAAGGTIPLLLAGMVGSNIGWRNLPYLKCPVNPVDIAAQCVAFDSRGHRVVMVPGVECTNDLGHPDLMRGEELQVMGWLAEDPGHAVGERLVCLPGTHTKWVSVRDGRILTFRTAITGELYSVLTKHSVLLALDCEPDSQLAFDPDEFSAGVAAAAGAPGEIMHLLFSTRSRMLKRAMMPEAAASYLSGLLIGADCVTIPERVRRTVSEVALVGEPGLCHRFSVALGQLGVGSAVLDGRRASLNGFAQLFAGLFRAGGVAATGTRP